MLGRIAVGAWAIGLVWFIFAQGFPFDRAYQTLWILSGLVLTSIGRGWRHVGRIFLDWIPLILVLYAYDYSRHFAEVLGRPVMIQPQIDWDRLLFFGVTPTIWLQAHFYDPLVVHWWDSLGSLIYISHFVAVWIIAAVLYWRNRDAWFLWVRAIVVLCISALVAFALVPSAPPWYAARDGYLPPVDRISTRGLDSVGLHGAKQLIDQGSSVTNDVAAIPSLHTGFAILIAIWFYPRVAQRHQWWLRPLLVLYPISMLAVLVYSGEHYVVDGLIAAVFVAGTLYGLQRWDRRRSRRTIEVDADTHETDAREGIVATSATDAGTP